MSAALIFSQSVSGDDNTDMLNRTLDLVRQAWNPAGAPPSDVQRTDWFTQAMKLAQNAPDHHLSGHRVQIILQRGDPDHKLTDYIRDADFELRTASSIAP